MAPPIDPSLDPTAPYFQSSPHTYHNNTLGEQHEHGFNVTTSLAPTETMYADATQALQRLNAQAHRVADNGGHIAELLQAANDADGQTQGQETVQGAAANGNGIASRKKQTSRSKRKRTQTPDHDGEEHGDTQDPTTTQPARPKKCTKRTKLSAAAQSTADASVTTTPPQAHRGLPQTPSTDPAHPTGLSAASVVALFRRPNTELKSRNTRPAMSSLFNALHVAPEAFLHIQAAAKEYMLDPAFPERQAAVGNKEKNNTDMAKIKLLNCAREFLEKDGIGERFFGESTEVIRPEVEGETAGTGEEGVVNGERQRADAVWPRDADKVIALVMPLLRRIVTNERQRQYALEAREAKKGVKKKANPSQEPHSDDAEPQSQQQEHEQEQEREQQDNEPPSQPAFDPTADPIPVTQAPSTDPTNGYIPAAENVLYILVTHRNVKLLPRIDIPAQQSYHPIPYESFYALVEAQVRKAMSHPYLASRSRSGSAQHDGPATPVLNGGNVMAEAGKRRLSAVSTNAESGSREPSQRRDSVPSVPRTETVSPERNTPVAEPLTPHTPNGSVAEQQHEQPSMSTPRFEIRAHTPHGLVPVRSPQAWEEVKVEIAQAIWMEGILRVIVQVL